MEPVSTPLDRTPIPPDLPPSGRMGWAWFNHVKAWLPLPAARRLARAALLVPAMRHYEREFGRLADNELTAQMNRLRGVARAGKIGRQQLAQAFGLTTVALWRNIGQRPYDVQLAAAVIMHNGGLVELNTGEGKTLTAVLTIALNALSGKGVHVATVNDYLAKRDAENMGPVYAMLGLSVGVLASMGDEAGKAEAYRKDITYGTSSSFGFDFLRDRMKLRGGEAAKDPFWAPWVSDAPAKLDPRMQRNLNFMLVDEADSILVDEARTPLIISAPTRPAKPEEQIVYHWANRVVRDMLTPNEHFLVDTKKDKIELTDAGRQVVRYSNPPLGPNSKAMDKLIEAVEKSINAHHRLIRDHHYMIINEKVVIVDEGSGRPQPDRQWREGLHQAVEAKEGVPIQIASDSAAQITIQSFARQYKKLAGMSGTVAPNWRELKRVYKLRVVCVPTNRPVIRDRWPDRIFPTEDAKFDAVVEEVIAMQQQGRPVLIGTRSVEKSEALSARLKAVGVEHQVLNARHHEYEARIVANAGRPGCVTVATNMAGRGTDIKLGGALDEREKAIRDDAALSDEEKRKRLAELHAEWQALHEEVVAAGGLHVIGTERHEALRIDRQLFGRAGRQGDPGSGQLYVSLEDQLLEAFGESRRVAWAEFGRSGAQRDWTKYRRLFVRAQRKMERKHYRMRLDVMHYQKQREEMLEDIGADPFVD